MLELLYQSTQTVELGVGIPKAVFIASWDAVLFHSVGSVGDFRKVFKDGTSFEMGQTNSFVGQFLSAEGGRGAVRLYQYIDEGGGFHDVNDVAMLDEISGLPVLGQNINVVDLSDKINNGSFIDHVNGLIYTPGTNQIDVYSLATGATVRTLALTGFITDAYTLLHYGGAASLLATKYYFTTDGEVAFIDRITGTITFKGKVNVPHRAVTYDSVHKVLIVLLETGKVAVYALNNVGYGLSAPSFSPSPALYTLSQVTTRLTSEDGQGVAGKAVLWYLTGDKGYLDKPVTLTDANGYAVNWYYAPAGDYGLGSETVNVEVVF